MTSPQDFAPGGNHERSKLKVLTAIAGVLALGEFGSAVMIWLENYRWPQS